MQIRTLVVLLSAVSAVLVAFVVGYFSVKREEADTETLFTQPKHPYTEALLSSVLTPDPNLDVPDTHLGAAYPNPVEPPSGCTFHPRCAKVMDQCSVRAPKPVATDEGHVECHLYDEAEGRAA